MCGIAGSVGKPFTDAASLQKVLNIIKRRGPDASGVWTSIDNRVTLIHTRLSILDLSTVANQPMLTEDERYSLVFNGEIYNHLELRRRLESVQPVSWKTSSDTETILKCIEINGVGWTLDNLNGMFAFALYDQLYSKITLARDKFGEKPLYYSFENDVVCFSSDLNAVVQLRGSAKNVSKHALYNYLIFGYTPLHYSIVDGIFKIAPGEFLEFSLASHDFEIHKYHSLSDDYYDIHIASNSTLDKAVQSLDDVLTCAVQHQLIADVPVGTFLSGGIDSSLITSIAVKIASDRLSTFSIGFEDSRYDESQYAASISKFLGTVHNLEILRPSKALEIAVNLPDVFDEPFGDPSAIPTTFLSSISAKHVKVCLTGDAGDELFAGYNRYLGLAEYWTKIEKIPYPIRKLISEIGKFFSPDLLSSLFSNFSLFNRWSNPGDKIYKGLQSAGCRTSYDMFILMQSYFSNADVPVKFPGNFDYHSDLPFGVNRGSISSMQVMDLNNYMPGNNLYKVDRAAMFSSLETRVPFLDKSVVRFAASLPLEYKIKNDGSSVQSKIILRELLAKYMPRELFERPKMGFGVPLSDWLKGPLRDWAESLLEQSVFDKHGLLNSKKIHRLWFLHLKGYGDFHKQIWAVLQFHNWLIKSEQIL